MNWFIAALLLPIPLAHLWLHALLPFWRRHTILFYTFSIALWFASLAWFWRIQGFSPSIFDPSVALTWVGYSLTAFGFFLAIWSSVTLGYKRFLVWVVLKPETFEHTFIIKGPFRHFPHPAYTGYIIAAMGNLLSSGEAFAAGVCILLLFFIPIMIYFEEAELQKRLGL